MTRRVLALLILGVVIAGTVVAFTVSRSTPAGGMGGYLAVGDSVTFGYREPDTLPKPVYTDPASFTGFPEDVGTALGLRVSNAGCTGETSDEFLHVNVATIGCPLHASYTGTQIQFATDYLRSHHDTKLVTVMIGINDVFRCQEDTSDNCVRELPGILHHLSANISQTLSELRADYGGPIVVVNYYPVTYLGADYAPEVNRTIDAAASTFHVALANGWSAFESAAADANGNVCAAGLLTELVGGGCGVHPSLAGQAILALAVEQAIHVSSPVTTTPPSSCPKGFRVGPGGVCVAG